MAYEANVMRRRVRSGELGGWVLGDGICRGGDSLRTL